MHIVDRVGGGDSFGGGLIYACLNGYDAQSTIEFAAVSYTHLYCWPRPEQKSPPASVRSRPGPSGPGSCRPLWQCRLTSLFFPASPHPDIWLPRCSPPGPPGNRPGSPGGICPSAHPGPEAQSRCSPRHSLKGRETGRPPPGAPEGCSAPNGSGTAYGSPLKASLPQQSAPHYNWRFPRTEPFPGAPYRLRPPWSLPGAFPDPAGEMCIRDRGCCMSDIIHMYRA